ncbi:MAG TPA: hypothetical protein PKA64_22200, partial [Myxococcota bacterium]|nr:hypothetical protein [Myxococcota bacterium]
MTGRGVLLAAAAIALGGTAVALRGSPTQGPPLPFQLCKSLRTVDVQPLGNPWRQLACAEPCDGTWTSCAEEDAGRDALGRPLRHVAFTVDGVAGMVRWNEPWPEQSVRAVVLLHGGGDGGEFEDHHQEMWSKLQADGLTVAAIKWYTGVEDPYTGRTLGWLARTGPDTHTHVRSTGRVAEVIRQLDAGLVPPTAKLGIVSTSNGALATVGAIAWHGVDDLIDWHFISSGNIPWDLPARCASRAGVRPPEGYCENDPALTCQEDAACGGPRDRCAWPQMDDGEARQADYRAASGGDGVTAQPHGHACFEGQADPAQLASSFVGTEVDLVWDHPADFIVAEGGPARGQRDDTADGFTWQMAELYRHVQITHPLGKRWVDLDGYYHGQGSGADAALPDLACAVRRGLDLTPRCPGDRPERAER